MDDATVGVLFCSVALVVGLFLLVVGVTMSGPRFTPEEMMEECRQDQRRLRQLIALCEAKAGPWYEDGGGI